MIFNTFSYFLWILLPAAVVFRLVQPSLRPLTLVLSGVVFFVHFSRSFGGEWLGPCCLVIFLWEAVISRLYRPGSGWCLFGIVIALAFLGVFKYWNFITGVFWAGGENPWHWNGAFLPLGLSFFTFEFIHFAIDRRKGKTEAGTFTEYLAFIMFFPTMVAGPIKRFQDFLPALRNPSTIWVTDWERGMTRILVGLAKKFVIADFLTSLTVHLNAADIAVANRWILPIWLLAFGLQIYFDFSAYSDIAIGSARLFGLPVKENFDWPYLQTNLAGFWQHWHMSLTRWLVDYVFIPLGGSRTAPARAGANIMATMLISGLWHGAGWNFVIWGLWHGLGLVIQRWWSNRNRNSSVAREASSGHFLAWGATFCYVNLGWAFFAMDWAGSKMFFRRLCLG
jgi:alginate O-acetyltransferase complex protein AlgI